MYRRCKETAEGEVEHREEGGATKVHAEPTEAGSIRDAEGGCHLSGELDGWLCFSRVSQTPRGDHDGARGN